LVKPYLVTSVLLLLQFTQNNVPPKTTQKESISKKDELSKTMMIWHINDFPWGVNPK
jgi:hypothetical protein